MYLGVSPSFTVSTVIVVQHVTHRDHTHTRRRRRCGPPVGQPRVPSPWCLPAPIELGCRCDGGGADRGPSPAHHHGGSSPLHIFLMVSWPTPRHTSTHSGYHPGVQKGGEAGHQLHFRCSCHPKGLGTQSHRCGPLARQVLLKGDVWPAGHGGLVCSLIPHPAVQPSLLRCQYAEGHTPFARAQGRGMPR